MLMMGGLTALAFFVFVLKLPAPVRRKALGFDILLDIGATILMMLAFGASGTYAGMAAAIVGGLIFSALLIIAKKVGGYEHPVWHDKRLHWVAVAGLFGGRTR